MVFSKQVVLATAKSVDRQSLTAYDERVVIDITLPDGRKWEVLVDCLNGEPMKEFVNSVYTPKELRK
jgi:hypothetical protein